MGSAETIQLKEIVSASFCHVDRRHIGSQVRPQRAIELRKSSSFSHTECSIHSKIWTFLNLQVLFELAMLRIQGRSYKLATLLPGCFFKLFFWGTLFFWSFLSTDWKKFVMKWNCSPTALVLLAAPFIWLTCWASLGPISIFLEI